MILLDLGLFEKNAGLTTGLLLYFAWNRPGKIFSALVMNIMQEIWKELNLIHLDIDFLVFVVWNPSTGLGVAHRRSLKNGSTLLSTSWPEINITSSIADWMWYTWKVKNNRENPNKRARKISKKRQGKQRKQKTVWTKESIDKSK